jgi:hypothetical protein
LTADSDAGGLTSWLSEAPDDALAELPEDVVDLDLPLATDEDAWDLEEDEDNALAWLSDESEADEAEGEAELSELSLAEDDEAEWDLAEDGLADWLSDEPDDELDDDGLLAEMTAVAAVVQSEPANDLFDDIPNIPSDELFATDEGNLPDWLSDGNADVTDIVAGTADLPDWLSDIESTNTDLPPALDSDHLLDSDSPGLLDFEDDLFGDMKIDEEEEEGETALASLSEAEDMGGLTSDGLTQLLAETDEASSALGDLDLDVDVSWLDDLTLVP